MPKFDPEAIEAELEEFGPPNSKLAWHQTMLMARALRNEIKRAQDHIQRSQYPAGAILIRSQRLSFTIETLQITVARLRVAQAPTYAVTYIGPSGEQTRNVEARNKEQARRALRKIVPTAHIIHVEKMEAS